MAELYRRSSQFREFSFTQTQLNQITVEANAKTNFPDDLKLTPQEERELVLFFASDRIKGFCDYFNLPSHVRATGVAYFRRFYLKHSVMDYDPKLVLPTAVFLAAKSENFFIPIAHFAEALNGIEQKEILDFEFTLFQTLGFNLTVHNALRPLHGFFLDMQSSNDFETSLLGQMHDQAKQLIVNAFANDIIFLYTPSQIALAALMESNEFVVTQYMAQSLDQQGKSLDQLLEIVYKCRELLKLGSQVTLGKDELKAVSKKLKALLNSHERPEGDVPNSKRQKTE